MDDLWSWLTKHTERQNWVIDVGGDDIDLEVEVEYDDARMLPFIRRAYESADGTAEAGPLRIRVVARSAPAPTAPPAGG